MDDDDNNRFSFATCVPVDDRAVEKKLSEDELKIQDTTVVSH